MTWREYLKQVWGYDNPADVDALTLGCIKENVEESRTYNHGWVLDEELLIAIERAQGVVKVSAREEFCLFCERLITDGADVSGCTNGPDWMADGDFGCDAAPETCEEGVGSHKTAEEVRAILRAVATDEKAYKAVQNSLRVKRETEAR